MSTEIQQSSSRGADSGQVTVANTSTLVVHATIDLDPTVAYPRRKKLIFTNTGTKAAFFKIGAAPTALTDYDFVLLPAAGTVDSSYTAPGTYIADVNVEQDNIYAITNSSTTTINVYAGV